MIEEALWDLEVAAILDPAVESRLTDYGELGERLQAMADRPPPRVPTVEQIQSAGGTVTGPALVSNVEAEYPKAMKRSRRGGRVVLGAVVDIDGRVRHPQLVQGGSSPAMLLSALEALRGKRFRPATVDGRPTAVQYSEQIEFEIE